LKKRQQREPCRKKPQHGSELCRKDKGSCLAKEETAEKKLRRNWGRAAHKKKKDDRGGEKKPKEKEKKEFS